MAKCVVNLETGKIQRLSEKDYKDSLKMESMVEKGIYKYIPKSEWKKAVRVKEEKKEVVAAVDGEVVEKKAKKSKKEKKGE